MKARKNGLPMPLPKKPMLLGALEEQKSVLLTAKHALSRAEREGDDTADLKEDLLFIKRRINKIKKLLNEVN